MKKFVQLLSVGLLALVLSAPASAGWKSPPKLSDILGANGFGTLLFALDTTGLTQVLDSNRVVVFAPTDDVFTATAQALGCTDALDLATRLINIPVGDGNALSAILTYHAYLGRIRSESRLLRMESVHTVNGADLMTGVNSEGLFVKGDANAIGSTITSGPISGWKWTVFPIDQILLPFAPPADLCS